MPGEAHDYEKLRESIIKLNLHASKNWRILEFPNDPENFFVQADRLSQAHPYDIEVLGDDKHPELYPNLVARSDAELLVLLRNSLPAILSALSLAVDAGWPFQQRVEPWFRGCFPPAVCNDRLERGDRLLEEVFELLQATGYPFGRVKALRDYVWGRDIGEPPQEVGGVMVTLAAFCIAHELDMHDAGEVELSRISQPEIMEKIRAKQAAKPTGSALPVALQETDRG